MSAIDPKAAGDSDPADKSRQKSCNACVRSKRRCDKRTPRCARCAEKNFACVYQNLPPSAAAGGGIGIGSGIGGGSSSAETSEDPLQAMDLEDADTAVPPAPHPFDLDILDSSPPGSTPGTFINGTLVMNQPTVGIDTGTASSMGLDLDANMGFDFNSVMDFLNADPVQGGEMQLWEAPQVPTAPKTLAPEVPYMGSICCGMERGDMLVSNVCTFSSRPCFPSSDLISSQSPPSLHITHSISSSSPVSHTSHPLPALTSCSSSTYPIEPSLHTVCSPSLTTETNLECMSQGDFQPWQIHEPDSRIGYVVTCVKDLHLTFSRTKAAPFIHRYLYRGVHSNPRPLLAAYTAISAYAGRTDSNKGWAMRAVCEGAVEVLKTAKGDNAAAAAAAASAAMTGHEKLARTQALLLLQTVRCFDGDVALRAQAERDMGVLETWLKELEGLRDNLDDVHLLDDLALRQRPPRSWEVWVFNECVRRTVLMGHIFTTLFDILKAAGETGECPLPFVYLRMIPTRGLAFLEG